MPVRSLSSSVFRWPDAQAVDAAIRLWAAQQAAARREVERIGYFGSYARGTWGVGSDLDVVVVVDHCSRSFMERASMWDTSALPVPCDVLVYTSQEFAQLDRESRFGKTLEQEVVWVYPAG